MANDIIKRMKAKGQNDVLATLSKKVEAKRKANNKLHERGTYRSIGNIVIVINL